MLGTANHTLSTAATIVLSCVSVSAALMSAVALEAQSAAIALCTSARCARLTHQRMRQRCAMRPEALPHRRGGAQTAHSGPPHSVDRLPHAHSERERTKEQEQTRRCVRVALRWAVMSVMTAGMLLSSRNSVYCNGRANSCADAATTNTIKRHSSQHFIVSGSPKSLSIFSTMLKKTASKKCVQLSSTALPTARCLNLSSVSVSSLL